MMREQVHASGTIVIDLSKSTDLGRALESAYDAIIDQYTVKEGS